MAYIQPNSAIEIFPYLGFDASYTNSLYFATTSQKDTYFSNLTKITTASALSYNRQDRNFVRVEIPISTIINAGYMRYKNTAFENKWFYAFITSVEYVNNTTTQINFETDVMMTWMGSFDFKQCFIERQHSETDVIGENTIPEPLECSDYVCEGTEFPGYTDLASFSVIVFKSKREEEEIDLFRQGTFVPVVTKEFTLSSEDPDGFTEYLEEMTAAEQKEIFTIKVVPSAYYTDSNDSVYSLQVTTYKPYSTISAVSNIKNKKLFTYPFKYLKAINMEGDSQDYRYEEFNGGYLHPDECLFNITGTAVTPEVEILCTPLSYEGIGVNYDKALKMTDFPTLAWNDDAYKAFIAQKDSTLVSGVVSGAISGAASGVSGGAIGAAVGAVSGAASAFIGNRVSVLLSDGMKKAMPNTARGQMQSNLFVQQGVKVFTFYKMAIKPELVPIYDKYFSMFGYAQNKVNTPNIHARPFYTYCKTLGCIVVAKSGQSLPADAANQIAKIMDDGCRFWVSHTYIGNYDLNNSPS